MNPEASPGPAQPAEPARPGARLRRGQRRDAIVRGAIRAFARTGYAATSLDDVAAEAAISRALLYRHFESKEDLYRAALGDIHGRIRAATRPSGDFAPERIEAFIRVAQADPDGFRLLFRHAAREPEFREFTDTLRAHMTAAAQHAMRSFMPDESQRRWAAGLIPATIIEAIIAWLDAGAPDPDRAPDAIRAMQRGIIAAIRGAPAVSPPSRTR